MSRTRTIDRIRKLMELAANNPNVAEATAATLKAQRMMAEHDIKDYEVMKTAEEAIVEIETGSYKGNPWAVYLGQAIADNFRCRMFMLNNGYRDWRGRVHKESSQVVFMGRQTDAEAATVTFEKLFEIGNRLAAVEARNVRQRCGTARGVKNSFLLGFVSGIRSELEKQCVALAIVTPKEVHEYAEERTRDFPTSNASIRNAYAGNSYGRGVEAGRDAMRAGRIEG